MTENPEVVPTEWTESDEAFFRLVGQVFRPDFLAGATVLLASYDDESEPSYASHAVAFTASASVPPATADEAARR